MNLRVYTKKSKEKLKLSPKPFASGGEGNLYKIIAPHQLVNFVVKIYHSNKLTTTKEEKINYLLKHPPQNTNDASIIWVKDIITNERGVFLGFMMPLVKGEKLEILCIPKLPKKLANTWYRFHNDAADALDLRLKVCYNLATAIHQIHACERYILVDLKPDNVIITPEGLVSLVDLDSVEVVENGYKLFNAPVATPEYTPPEHYKKDNEYDPTQQQAWDRFSMAVIFYKLLMGIHPFAGSFRAPYETATTLAQKIEHGLFVHSPTISKYKKSIPPPHQAFFQLGNELQGLFCDCFVKGSNHPELRPTAHAWCSAIMQHLDIHRFRNLPSKIVKMPPAYLYWASIHQQAISPTDFLNNFAGQQIDNVGNKSKNYPSLYNQNILNSLRKVNLAILVLGFIYGGSTILYGNDSSVGYLVIFVCLLFSCVILFFSFMHRQNNRNAYLSKIKLSDTVNFFRKQQYVFEGILEHLESFWLQLNKEYQKLFPNTATNSQGNIQQIVDQKLQELNGELDRQDRIAKDLIDSEVFEYASLKDKYNRALRVNASFITATSLDAELSAIDFAMQESMEELQKTLGKELKNTQFEYDQLFNKDERILIQKERIVKNKIGKYKKHLAKAQRQEERKLLTQLNRQIKKDMALIEPNVDLKLTLFKDEIVAFLSQHNIKNINQIKNIQPPGIVTLDTNKNVSIAPLRYYQIHELLEWWMAACLGHVELSVDIKEEITNRYDNEFRAYKKELKAELYALQEKTLERKQSLGKEALAVLENLHKKNQPQILALKEKFKAQKDFLTALFKERAKEEQEIHIRYEKKFDALLEAAQKQVDLTNHSIKQIYQVNNRTSKQLDAYKKNLQKYDLGLKRLEEEYQRLQESKQRYKNAQEQAAIYNELAPMYHLYQMFFLKSLDS